MEGGLGLLLSDLPQDVLLHICLFLRYNDLIALSATCRYLRNVINVDCVWKRVVGGDVAVLGRLPELSDPRPRPRPSPSCCLPPLCRQRVLSLRRARLVNNVRNRRFSKQTTNFTGYLYTSETTQTFITKTCTLDGNYLFGIDYESEASQNEVVKVISLGGRLISTVTDFRPHGRAESYSVIVACQVVGDKLVVRQDDLFKVYQIDVPALRFSLLHLINAQHGPSECDVVLVGNFIFSENDFIKVIRVWDIHTGQQFDSLASKVKGFDLTVIGHSADLRAVLFLSRGSERAQSAFVFEYSTTSMAFTEFSIRLENLGTHAIPIVGLLNNEYITILIPTDTRHDVSVRVYDRNRSVLVCEKEFENIVYSDVKGGFFTIDDCIALRSLAGIKIIALSNLEIRWQILFDNATGYKRIYELPVLINAEYQYINIANALHLIAISTNKCVSFWDFELRRKLFELPAGSTDICVDDSCTKLIFRTPDREELCVWSWTHENDYTE